MSTVISCKQLECGYGTALFQPINVSLKRGESLAITGRSGIGKTTLLSTILGLMPPVNGTVTINGTDIHSLTFNERAGIRNKQIGVVFQHSELLGRYTAIDNVALPRLLLDKKKADQAYDDARQLLQRLDVECDTLAENLSGGERSRVALARALINNPSLILADEPTGALDDELRAEVMDLIMKAVRDYQCALIIVTHDKTIAAEMDNVIMLHQ